MNETNINSSLTKYMPSTLKGSITAGIIFFLNLLFGFIV